jgi:hypothetical protein
VTLRAQELRRGRDYVGERLVASLMALGPTAKGTALQEAGLWGLLRTTLLRDSISSLRLGLPLLPGIDLPTRLDDVVAKVDRVQRVEKTSPFSGLFNAADRVRVHGFPDQAGVDFAYWAVHNSNEGVDPVLVLVQCKAGARSW